MGSCKLTVDLLSGRDLLPLHHEGSSLYIQLRFDDQRMSSTAKQSASTMIWNERFYFNVLDPSKIGEVCLKVLVYNFNKDRKSHQILGQVRITGRALTSSTDADVIYYALEKSSMFFQPRGHLGLKVFLLHDNNIPSGASEVIPSSNSVLDGSRSSQADQVVSIQISAPLEQSFPRQVDELTTTLNSEPLEHSFPSQANQVSYLQNSAPLDQAVNFAPTESTDLANYGRVIDCGFERKIMPRGTPLVPAVQHVFVRVVRARNLPDIASGGGVDPFVEVVVGAHKVRTTHLEKTYNPEWDAVYAFSIDLVKEADFVEVFVKHNDKIKDDFIGMVRFHTHEIQKRTSNEKIMYPGLYPLRYENMEIAKGEIMLAVWMGDQADAAFADAMSLESASASGSFDRSCIRSSVYEAPTLWYMRVSIIEAYGITQARVPLTNLYVKGQVAHQRFQTKMAQAVDLHPCWNEDLMFVIAEPLEGELILTIEGKNEVIGRAVVPVVSIDKRNDDKKVDRRTCPIEVTVPTVETNSEGRRKSGGHLVIQVCLEGGYHVLDEPMQLCSDLRPTAKELWKNPVGRLELGILKVEGIPKMKTRDGLKTVNAYCVAKYGKRWIRTRTVMNSSNPIFNEEHSWDVYDGSTFITIGIFYNCQIAGLSSENNKDVRIGQIYIQVSTLPMGSIFTQKHPLQLLLPSGIKKTGEIHLSIRFSCTSILRNLYLYSRPILPEMHQKATLTDVQVNDLREQAVEIIATRLSRLETPLRKEVILCIYGVVSDSWSWRKSTQYNNYIMSVSQMLNINLSSFEELRSWKKIATSLPCFLLSILMFEVIFEDMAVILGMVFLLCILGIIKLLTNYLSSMNFDTRIFPVELMPMLGEEIDQLDAPASDQHAGDGYQMLRNFARWAQTLLGNVAIFMDKIEALLTWRDQNATIIFIFYLCACFALLPFSDPTSEHAQPYVRKYVILFQQYGKHIICTSVPCLMVGPPRLRQIVVGGSARIFLNFFRRLPTKTSFLL